MSLCRGWHAENMCTDRQHNSSSVAGSWLSDTWIQALLSSTSQHHNEPSEFLSITLSDIQSVNGIWFQVTTKIIPSLFIRNGGVAALTPEDMKQFFRSPGEVASMLAKPKEGKTSFFQVAAILMLDESAKVVNATLKMGRHPLHKVALGTSVLFPGIEPAEGQGKIQVILGCRLNEMVFPEEGLGRNLSLPRDGKIFPQDICHHSPVPLQVCQTASSCWMGRRSPLASCKGLVRDSPTGSS